MKTLWRVVELRRQKQVPIMLTESIDSLVDQLIWPIGNLF